MTVAYRWVLWGGAAVVAVLAAIVVGAALAGRPEMPAEMQWLGLGAFWGVWLPVAAGLLLTWFLAGRTGQAELHRRTETALMGHPIVGELGVLLASLVGYIAAGIGLYQLFKLVIEDIPPGIGLPVARIVFLFLIPVLLVDRGGFTVSGHSTAMPGLAMRVREPWRWLGLVTVAVCVALASLDIGEVALAGVRTVLFSVAVAAAVCMIEEIFFRGMVQTRLELLMGRAPAVVLTALLFAGAHAVSGHFNPRNPLSYVGFIEGAGASVLTFGLLGLLLGYVWVRYRNIWVNALLYTGLVVAGMLPVAYADQIPFS